jgi:hypothetical protein
MRCSLALALGLMVAFLPGPGWGDGLLDRFGDAFPANAPPMPVCNGPREGVAACLAGRQCLCTFERGGSITGRPDGYRWDCGILRPACGVAPAEAGPPAAAVPIFPQVTVPEMGGGQDSRWNDGGSGGRRR